MPWKGGNAPDAPILGRLESLPDGVEISWMDNDPDTAYFAIYRFNAGEKMDITSDSSAYKLIATVRKNSNGVQKFVDYGFWMLTAYIMLLLLWTGCTMKVKDLQ